MISAVLFWIVVYLTHLDYQDTERIMTEKLQNQVNGTEWSWKNLNTVSSNLIIVTYTALYEKGSEHYVIHTGNFNLGD